MTDNNKPKKAISRRNFLKTIGVAGAVTAGLNACVNRNNNGTSTISTREIPTDQTERAQLPEIKSRYWVSE